ncbi:hypothetical protein AMTRI_Chr09g39560 [Amborella trichopoda]
MVVGGDFNVIKWTEESSVCHIVNSCMRGFSEFISEFGLLDFPIIGAKFTWSNNSNRFSKASSQSLPKLLSHHIPLIWESETLVNSRGYFKFEMALIRNCEVNELVKSSWPKEGVAGWNDFKASKKIQNVKKEIIKWKKSNWVSFKKLIEEILSEITEIDLKEWDSRIIEWNDRVLRNRLNKDLQSFLLIENPIGNKELELDGSKRTILIPDFFIQRQIRGK